MLITLGLAMWIKGLLSVGFLFVCIILILTVLIQRPSGGGLSGAFGSASGSGQTAFGAKTGDALTIFTIVMFVLFVLSAIGMKFVTSPQGPAPPPGITSGDTTVPADADTPSEPADVGGPARPPEGTPPVQGPGLPEADPESPEGEAPSEPEATEPGADPTTPTDPTDPDPEATGPGGG